MNKLRETLNEDRRVYYRGSNPGDTRRISTGNKQWDDNLFVSKDRAQAENYGKNIEEIVPKATAKIVTEGTPEFSKLNVRHRSGESLLDWCTRVILKAEASGYDIVEFALQGTIGTVILNLDSVIRDS